MVLEWYFGFFKGKNSFYSDSLFANGKIFAVADGMGNKGTGKIAADIAIEIIKDSKSPYELEENIKKANIEIIKKISSFDDFLSFGTTLSVLFLEENIYRVYHIGDSKIFLIRNSNLIKLTEDQKVVKDSKIYVKALGINWDLDILKKEGEICKGDIFLMFTDGFCEFFLDKEIIMKAVKNKEVFQNYLQRNISKKLPEDDISYIIVWIK